MRSRIDPMFRMQLRFCLQDFGFGTVSSQHFVSSAALWQAPHADTWKQGCPTSQDRTCLWFRKSNDVPLLGIELPWVLVQIHLRCSAHRLCSPCWAQAVPQAWMLLHCSGHWQAVEDCRHPHSQARASFGLTLWGLGLGPPQQTRADFLHLRFHCSRCSLLRQPAA